MKKNLAPILFTLLIGTVALWYFGHHRPTQKMLKTEPKKIYKTTTPVTSKTSTVNQNATETPTHARGNAAGMESTTAMDNTETVDSSIKSMDTSTMPTDTTAHSQHDVSTQDTPALSEHEVSEDKDSDEESANEVSRQLIDEADAALEEAARLQKEAHTVLANQLNAMSVEKQTETLNKMREGIINAVHPSTQEPMFNTRGEAEDEWQTLFNGIIDAGYTPPDGFR